jgi:hypothetical protein
MQDTYNLVKEYVGLAKPLDAATTYTDDFLDKSIKMKAMPAAE